MLQPKLDSFSGFTNALRKITRSRYTEVEDIDEAMGLTAVDLANSAALQDNVALRNNLQKSLPLLSTATNGSSIAQLRKQRRKTRQPNIYESMAALPACSEMQAIANIITPCGKNNNSRKYRNQLHHGLNDSQCDNELSTITESSNLKSVISNEDDRQQVVNALRKKVMKRLIDVASPTDDNKKALLHLLVTNDAMTKEIVEMAVEMGSSVEDTKRMLMNNCL